MEAVLVSDVPGFKPGPNTGCRPPIRSWSRVTRIAAIGSLRYVATPIEDRADLPTFTDSHHNMFRVLK